MRRAEQCSAAEGLTLVEAAGIDCVASFIMSFVLLHAVHYAGAVTLGTGAAVGFFNWLGFLATVTLGLTLYEGRPLGLFLITNGCQLVSLSVEMDAALSNASVVPSASAASRSATSTITASASSATAPLRASNIGRGELRTARRMQAMPVESSDEHEPPGYCPKTWRSLFPARESALQGQRDTQAEPVKRRLPQRFQRRSPVPSSVLAFPD